MNPGDDYFDTYSFGLVGDCNEVDAWAGISESPKLTVTWKVEPKRCDVKDDPEEEKEELEIQENVPEEDVQDEAVFENKASGDPAGSGADEQGEESGNQTQQADGELTENAGVEPTSEDNGGEETENPTGDEMHADDGKIDDDSSGAGDSTQTEGVDETGAPSLNENSDNEDSVTDYRHCYGYYA